MVTRTGRVHKSRLACEVSTVRLWDIPIRLEMRRGCLRVTNNENERWCRRVGVSVDWCVVEKALQVFRYRGGMSARG